MEKIIDASTSRFTMIAENNLFFLMLPITKYISSKLYNFETGKIAKNDFVEKEFFFASHGFKLFIYQIQFLFPFGPKSTS